MKKIKGIDFREDKLILIDQTKLPFVEDYIVTDDYERISVAIEKLEVRGAPAIGISAAYALALAFKSPQDNSSEYFLKVYKRLASTRPTAVNLFWALKRMEKVFNSCKDSDDIYLKLLTEAEAIFNEDKTMCDQIAQNGLKLFNKKLNVLTHCNTGALVTAGGGTALNIIITAFENELVSHVFADETRPLLQGSRLTAFELDNAGIPFSIITDSSAAFVMKQKKVDMVIVGADRIARNGDAANKIGTYNLAVLASHHKIPFYIAAPTSTIDSNCSSGEEIKIEERASSEVNSIHGVKVTNEKYPVYTPAFDVTPNKLITAIITEKDIHYPPYNL